MVLCIFHQVFWDVDYQHGEKHRILPYDVYSSYVTGLSFDNFNPVRLFSTAKDGEIRLLDFHSGVFDEVYLDLNKGTHLTHHVQVDSSCLLVSQGTRLLKFFSYSVGNKSAY